MVYRHYVPSRSLIICHTCDNYKSSKGNGKTTYNEKRLTTYNKTLLYYILKPLQKKIKSCIKIWHYTDVCLRNLGSWYVINHSDPKGSQVLRLVYGVQFAELSKLQKTTAISKTCNCSDIYHMLSERIHSNTFKEVTY